MVFAFRFSIRVDSWLNFGNLTTDDTDIHGSKKFNNHFEFLIRVIYGEICFFEIGVRRLTNVLSFNLATSKSDGFFSSQPLFIQGEFLRNFNVILS